jgi:hypothetical protein
MANDIFGTIDNSFDAAFRRLNPPPAKPIDVYKRLKGDRETLMRYVRERTGADGDQLAVETTRFVSAMEKKLRGS